MGTLCTIVEHKIFRAARNNTKVLMSSCKLPDIFCPILMNFRVPRHIFIKVPIIKFQESPSSESRADIYGRTDMTKAISAFHDLRERA